MVLEEILEETTDIWNVGQNTSEVQRKNKRDKEIQKVLIRKRKNPDIMEESDADNE